MPERTDSPRPTSITRRAISSPARWLIALVCVVPPLAFAIGSTWADGYPGDVDVQNTVILECREQLSIDLVLEGGHLFSQAMRLGCELEAQSRSLSLAASAKPFITLGQADAELREMAELAATDIDRGNTALWGQARFRMAFLLHRYGALVGWSPETRTAVYDMLRNAHWPWQPIYQKGELDNWELPRAGAWTLAGEALGDAEMLQEGIDLLSLMAGRVARQGSPELNSPHYASHLWDNLVLMTEVQDAEARALVDALLGYVAMTAAHLYLPGGGLGSPQARGTRGGSSFVVDPDPNESHAISYIRLLLGDPDLEAEPAPMAALTHYALPDLTRSVFLDKGFGYEFRGRHFSFWTTPPAGRVTYDVGWRDLPTIPWQTVTLPGGSAQMGIMYGAAATASQDVSMGVYLRTPTPNATFTVLAHVHPTLPGWSDEDPDLADPGVGPPRMHERSTYQRFMHGRALIQLWDTSLEGNPGTQMHIPLYGDPGQGDQYHEVDSPLPNRWRIGRSGDVYVAILPLGSITSEALTTPNTGTLPYQHVELGELSGSIVELATTEQFATIEAYGDDLAGRLTQFLSSPELFGAKFVTASGEMMFLNYTTGERILGGVVQSDEPLRSGLMQSPFVSWDESTFALTLQRPSYDPIVLDFGDPTKPTAPHSVLVSRGGPLISDEVWVRWEGSLDDGSIDHYEVWMRTDAGERLVADDISASPGVFNPEGELEEATASFFVRAVDNVLESSRNSNVVHGVRVGPRDEEPPSAPGNLGGFALGPGVVLIWDASADNREVTSYRVYRSDPDPLEIEATQSPFVDTEGLAPDTDYTYHVRALDAAGNQSAASNTFLVRTKPEFEPPEPVRLFGSPVGSRIFLHWFLYEEDESGTGSYLIYRDGVFVTFASPLSNWWWDNNVEPGVTYTYTVYVWDVHANGSPPSNIVPVTAN